MPAPIKVAHLTTADITLRYLLWSQLQALQREGYEVVGISAPGDAVADLERRGIRHIAVNGLTRNLNPLADLRVCLGLWRLCRRERFTVVHTHAPKTGVLGRLAARLAGVPVVVNTVHGLFGLDGGTARRAFYLLLERVAARVSDHEFCQSREDLELLRRLRIVDPARSSHLGNGIDLGYFDPGAVRTADLPGLRRELGLPETALVVGTVGRLVWEKGYREFFQAAAEVRRHRPDVHFLVVGPADPSKPDAVSADARTRAGRDGVRFAGWRSDMREVYALMDIFVLASYREGFPRAAMEAAAMGKALVLTDIRGCREVVEHEHNGLLVPARQVRPLVDAILALVGDDALRARLGQASRARARAEFDEQRVVAQVLGVYRDLLKTRGRLAARVPRVAAGAPPQE